MKKVIFILPFILHLLICCNLVNAQMYSVNQEFSADAEIVAISMKNPVYNAEEVRGVLKNTGRTEINALEIKWQVLNKSIHTLIISDMHLATGELYNFKFSDLFFLPAGNYQLKVWISQINGVSTKTDSQNSVTRQINVVRDNLYKVPFFEEFASSTCAPCAAFNNVFNLWCSEHANDITLLKYPMNWPGSGDAYYTQEGGARRDFYEVSATPSLFGNGSMISVNINSINNFYNSACQLPAYVSIAGNFMVAGTNIIINANILPYQDFPTATLFVVVFERTTSGNASSNGETEFHNIMMKMVPDTLGTSVDLNDLELYQFSQTINMAGTNVEDYNDLGVVVFIQDIESSEIYQSAYILEDNVISPEARLSEIRVDNIPVEGFDPDIFSYNVILAEGQDTLVPVVGYPLQGNPVITYEYPETLPGDVIINVRSEDLTTTNIYIVRLELFPNYVPTDITISASGVDENIPAGTVVGRLATADNDLNDTHSYTFVAGEGDTDNFRFFIDGDTLLTAESFDYETKSTYTVRIQTDDGEGGLFSKALSITVNNLNDMVLTAAIFVNPFCDDDPTGSIEIEVSEFIPPLSFLWSSGQTTQNIYDITAGNYSVTISDGAGMALTEQFYLEPIPIYADTRVCYLTSDAKYNVVYIDKGLDNYNVDKYNIYREGSNAGVYNKIGEIDGNDISYTDSAINNMSRSYSYKVTMTDNCGNESPMSENHRTIHLSINSGTNNEVNLFWNHYIGINTLTYSIYRKRIGGEFILLEEISSNNNTYTDFPPELNSLYEYYISFEVDNSCNTSINRATSSNIVIQSNHVTLGGIGGISEYYNDRIKVQPNPVSDKLIININNADFKVDKIMLYNSNGNLMFESKVTDKPDILEIPVQKFTPGVYFLHIYSQSVLFWKKVVII